MELAKASDFHGLLKVIRHTPYYDILKSINTDSRGHIPYTECEVRLRTYYLRWLIEKASECVHGKSKKALLDQINVQTDVINLINAYRMKKYFYADAQTLKKYMLPFYGRLSKEKQFVLFETQSPEDYLRMLAGRLTAEKWKRLRKQCPASNLRGSLSG